ncbi:MAG: hypothetical protein ACKN81_16700, partial [Pirellulaceae bacterium]
PDGGFASWTIFRSHPPRCRGGYEEVATIARWWMSSLDDLRDHTPLGRSGYEGEDLDNAEAIGSDQRTVGVDSDMSETSPSPLRLLALLFATLRDGLVT